MNKKYTFAAFENWLARFLGRKLDLVYFEVVIELPLKAMELTSRSLVQKVLKSDRLVLSLDFLES
jgi:hypothetical protein